MSKNKFWQQLRYSGALFLTAIAMTIFGAQYYQSLAENNNINIDWAYEGEANAHRWGLLAPEFESCRLGDQQSPVNIKNVDHYNKTAPIKFNYQPGTVDVVNNGHTIQVNYPPGSTILLNNEEYELLQFHFHTPSEHMIDNKTSAMEAHFVHKNKAGKLAVVGVLIDSGTDNPLIASIWEATPNSNKANNVSKIRLNAANLLPDNKNFYSYEGSLTTPPCSEGVSWNVFSEPVEVSPEQITFFEQIFSNNARPTQPLNDRPVEYRRGN